MTLKIATFNVNSVKSRIPVLIQWFETKGAPDILCLQETKSRSQRLRAWPSRASGSSSC